MYDDWIGYWYKDEDRCCYGYKDFITGVAVGTFILRQVCLWTQVYMTTGVGTSTCVYDSCG